MTRKRTGAAHRWACLFALNALIGLGCSPTNPNIVACKDAGTAHVICGLKNVEDLARIPESSLILLGQGYGTEATEEGNIALLDPDDESVSVLYRGGTGSETARSTGVWGDPDCPGPPPPAFSPHGIDLAAVPDGRLRLLVINHGGRESVEFFELKQANGTAALVWRGCALPPEEAYLNDVANLPTGGLVATHMMDRSASLSGALRGLLGRPTGFVYEWQPGEDFESLPGTEGALPNGIQVSPDGKTLYVNLYLASQLRAIDRASGQTLGSLEVSYPDNLTWASNGNLLVASHFTSLGDVIACMQLQEGACGMPFEILSVSPENLEARTIYSNEGAPMGAGTAAVDLDGELVIGSFSSDRLLRVRAQP